MWKNLWWDKARGEDARPSRAGPWTQPIGTVHDEELAADIQEKKWVRLYICVDALPYIDDYGLDHCAKKAGLDLYAWTKDHWEPGSRQPLRLKVSDTGKAKKDKKIWPDYEKHLNQGKPLAEIFAGPEHYRKPIPWNQRKAMTFLGSGEQSGTVRENMG
ncbi:50S ribosomal protein L28 [Durusdinium trenchii]|uniref:50S ribosomal protein L28 n=1 Tax=Durusdinium trenchii TaxID=1381693 RepID=A0ABP0HAK2_9DINO